MIRPEKSRTPDALDERLPERERSVESDEDVRQVVLVGHVADVTQVEVVTLRTLPANAAHFVQTTYITRDVRVTHACHNDQNFITFFNSVQTRLEAMALSYINSLALVLCVHLSLLSALLTRGTVYLLLLILVHSVHLTDHSRGKLK